MFDIGFSELLLIAIIGILVIGPKRLPETLRFVGLWVGRMKRGMSRAYQELEREVGLDDVRRQLHNEDILRSLEKKSPPTGETDKEHQDDIKPVQDKPNDTP